MSHRSPITTHVLDLALGVPAAGMDVVLEAKTDGGGFVEIARGTTNADGRVADLLPPGAVQSGVYRLTFDTENYFAMSGQQGFYPAVSVLFRTEEERAHYHVPLLLSPWGYSTYRGS